MTVVYHWMGGGGSVQLDERLVVEADGSGALWRTVCAGVVGDFSVALDASAAEKLAALAAEAAAAGPVGAPPRPGEPEELVSIGASEEDDDAVESVVRDRHDPGGPWGALYGALRELRDPAGREPRAAVGLEGDPDALRLVHRGPEPLDLAPDPVGIEVTAVAADNSGVSSWSGRATVSSRPDPGSLGWSVELRAEHGLTPPAGGRLLVSALPRLLVGGYPKQMLVSLPLS